MEKKDIMVSLQDVKNMVEKKMQKEGAFPVFAISFSLVTGDKMIQLDPWEDEEHKRKDLTNMVIWLREQQAYGIIFGSPSTKRKYKTMEDFHAKVNAEVIDSIILVAKTPEKTFHLGLEYRQENGVYVFEEFLTDMTNEPDDCFLNDVFEGVN